MIFKSSVFSLQYSLSIANPKEIIIIDTDQHPSSESAPYSNSSSECATPHYFPANHTSTGTEADKPPGQHTRKASNSYESDSEDIPKGSSCKHSGNKNP